MHRHRCTVPDCSNPGTASGPSPLCDLHRRVQYRHGHPEQSALRVQELLPYRRRIAAIRKANPDNATWRNLEERWAGVIQDAQATLSQWERGLACGRYYVQAARHVQAIALEASPADVVEASLAVCMLWARNPHRILSPRAFDHQLVRRIRSLALSSSGESWDHKNRRMKRYYRDMPPRVVALLAGQLRSIFMRSALQLTEMERSLTSEPQRLQDAVAALRLP